MRQAIGVVVLGTTIFLAAREIRDSYASYDFASISLTREVAFTPSFHSLGNSPREVADNFLKGHQKAWQVQSYHNLKATQTAVPNGTKIHYAVYQDNIPIVGIGVDIVVASDLSIFTIQNNYRPIVHLNLGDTKTLPVKQVVKRIPNLVADADSLQNASALLYVDSINVIPELVYVVRMHEDENRSQWWKVMFRAKDGHVLGKTLSLNY